MRYGVRVLSRPEIGAGFSLAGLQAVGAQDGAEAIERLQELVGSPEIGVVLMQASLHDGLPEDLRRDLGRRPLPMVVPVPEPSWAARPEAADAYIVELLRQVIGYRVRLR